MSPTARDLFCEAAAFVPPPPEGFERAMRRGRRLRRQAAAARVAVPLAVVGLAAALVLAPGDRSREVDVVDDPRTSTTTTTTAPAVGGRPPAPGAAPGPSTGHQGGGTVAPSTAVVPRQAAVTTTTTTAFVPAPPGARIAYASTGGHLHTMRPDGGDRRLLSSGPLTPFAWSPDRRALLVTSGGALDTLDVETGARRTLLHPEDTTVMAADYSPDGRRIVYGTRDTDTVRVDGRPWLHIWVANVDGTNARELPVAGEHPSWSPDGTRILLSGCTGATGSSYVCTIRPDGTGLTGLDTPMFQWPRWSPDGQWIAGVYDNTRLAVVRPDGSGLRELVGHARTARFAWTTDSGHIVYSHDDGGLARVTLPTGADVRLSPHLADTNPVGPWR